MSQALTVEVSLKNLVYNAKKINEKVKKGVLKCAVVKSNAYGHGIGEIAKALYSYCDMFAVSLASEAKALRFCGIDKPIIILTPISKDTLSTLLRFGVILTVQTLSELLQIENCAKKMGVKCSVHLAVNVGMNRLGFNTAKEIERAIAFCEKSNHVNITGAYSHFGAPANKDICEKDYNRFISLTKVVVDRCSGALLHLAASGGLLLDEKYQLSMVRVGLLYYGYTPFLTDKIKLKPIMKIYAHTVLVRNNLSNARLLYGEDENNYDKITILRLGYADGFLRRGVLDSLKPLCMDLCAIKGAKRKSRVCVMNCGELLAKKWDTTIYEVLTMVSKRGEFIYK